MTTIKTTERLIKVKESDMIILSMVQSNNWITVTELFNQYDTETCKLIATHENIIFLNTAHIIEFYEQ
jgi:hypothetical protein